MLDVIILLSVAIILLSWYILSRPSKDEILYEADIKYRYEKIDKMLEKSKEFREIYYINRKLNDLDLWVKKDEWIYIWGVFCNAYILYSQQSKDKYWVIEWETVKLIHRCYNLDDMENFVLWYKRALDDNIYKKKSKNTDDTIILENLCHSNHREITQDLMNHINAYNSFAKYLRLNHKDHDKYDKKIYEYYDALWDQNKITSRRLWMFSHITEQQIQEGK